MSSNDLFRGIADSPKNEEQKCLCVLVLDVSGSMRGPAIKELNAGLAEFKSDIESDLTTSDRLEISIITFGEKVKVIQMPTLIEAMKTPELEADEPSTKLVDGIREGIRMVNDRKAYYKSTNQNYYRPWIITITDGSPDPNQDVQGIATEIHEGMESKNFHFFAIGVQGADMQTLKRISHSTMPPAELKGLKFGAFFKWLSKSMGMVVSSADGSASFEDPTEWMKNVQTT